MTQAQTTSPNTLLLDACQQALGAAQAALAQLVAESKPQPATIAEEAAPVAGMMTVAQLAQHNKRTGRYPDSERSIRHLLFHDQDGFRSRCAAKVGARVLINLASFEEWISERTRKAA